MVNKRVSYISMQRTVSVAQKTIFYVIASVVEIGIFYGAMMITFVYSLAAFFQGCTEIAKKM